MTVTDQGLFGTPVAREARAPRKNTDEAWPSSRPWPPDGSPHRSPTGPKLRPRLLFLSSRQARCDRAGGPHAPALRAPVREARLQVPRTAAVWLTTDDAVARARVHAAGRYEAATEAERRLMDKFLARTARYQTLMIDAVDRLHQP